MVAPAARLPGLRFETQSPPPSITLPRTDIAVFVGFAAAGPLHRPVAVEDPAQFANVFGRDLRLAWDAERGESAYAYLGPAVRAFFRNSGRRCWVIRVADTESTLRRSGHFGTRPAARSNRFPLLGLVGLDHGTGVWCQATVNARSEGSWSDGVRVGAELQVEPASVITCLQSPAGTVALGVDVHAAFAPGDLVRSTLPDSGYVLLLAVENVSDLQPGPPASGVHAPAKWLSGPQAWFSTRIPPGLASTAVRARVFDGALDPQPVAVIDSGLDEHGAFVLHLALSGADLPGPGALVKVDFAGLPTRTAWLSVDAAQPRVSASSPLQESVKISGKALLWLTQAPPLNPIAGRMWSERLTFDLHARLGFERWTGQANSYPMQLGNLGFAPAHPRYWGRLPTDTDLYPPPDQATNLTPELFALHQEVSNPRFPMAGAADELLYLPLGITRLLNPDLMRGPQPSPETELERDGLTSFGADVFVDGDLADTDVMVLLDEADFLRYQQPQPRSLTGIHAALGLGEPALIAAPDAVHRGWIPDVRTISPPVLTPTSPPPPDDCTPAQASPNAPGQFAACDALSAPVLDEIKQPLNAAYSVSWSLLAASAIQYVLEESSADNFADAAVVYRGAGRTVLLEGRAEGTYFYRVRAESASVLSSWSNIAGVALGDGVGAGWRMLPSNSFTKDAVEALHLGLLTLSASAGDLLAVLSLPSHYREDAAIEHVTRLASRLTIDRDRTLSFGALYHPWLIGRDDASAALRQGPPDGTMCGAIAGRALSRGPWVAPANESLQGVLALTPPLARERRLDLQEGHINVVRQEPTGFRVLSANTLSADETVRPINVRRLMSLLRRLALREGANYVFEPNDASFRRLVERGFEALLDDLFMRGAFAGATPDNAYQVNTASALNTPRDQDAGRFIVELKVAPARPLTFLTIRLLQHGRRELAIVEG